MAKHAYCIIAHNEPTILKRLVDQLDDYRNDIYILVDAKSDIGQFTDIQVNYSNLRFIDNRINILWGDFSQVRAELLILNEALSGGEYSYFHLLSGVDLCIKSQDHIHDFFNSNAGKEFIDVCTDDKNVKDANYKFKHYFFLLKQQGSSNRFVKKCARFICRSLVFLQKLFRLSRKSDSFSKIAKGSNWASISRDFCKYLLDHQYLIEREFKYVYAADEIFLPTMFINSPFAERQYLSSNNLASNLRAIDWSRGKPYVWRFEDCEALLNSDYLWARKFSTTHDKTAVDYIMLMTNGK